MKKIVNNKINSTCYIDLNYTYLKNIKFAYNVKICL